MNNRYTTWLPRVLSLSLIFFAVFLQHRAHAQAFSSLTPLAAVPTTLTAATGEKPQSKVWLLDGKWWAVFASEGSTGLWRLDGSNWTRVLILSPENAHADCKVQGNIVHVLLVQGSSANLVSLEYRPVSSDYQLWPSRPNAVTISLGAAAETATIDIDDNGRMWLAYDGSTVVNTRWSDAPYSTWSEPVEVATGINSDDICTVIAMPGKTGVMWSNQSTSVKRFGFRTIAAGADPAVPGNWSADEIPASQSAVNYGAGMADDHLNLKLAADGTLYCAVKTSYDGGGHPRIALLVRQPDGSWDDLHDVGSAAGTRPIVVLNEQLNKLKVIYTSQDGGGNILYRETAFDPIAFGPENTLISGNYNNVTSAKQPYEEEIVVLASSGSQVVGVLAGDGEPEPPSGEGSLVGFWKMEETGNVLNDASGYGNHATAAGNPGRITGKIGQAIALNGSSQYALVPDNPSLDITGAITLAAWIKPNAGGTQYILRKGNQGGPNGYELSLAISGKVFFRINQGTGGNNYRIDSQTGYPVDGNTWMHVAGTYDGQALKLYINGTLEASLALSGTLAIGANDLPLGIGAQSDGDSRLNGALDEVQVYNQALTAAEVLALSQATNPPPSNIDNGAGYAISFDGSNDYVNVPTNSSLNLSNQLTLETWVMPMALGTQRLISKAIQDGTNGYEISLSSPTAADNQRFFVRFNQQSGGNSYRVNSTTLYEVGKWYHVAATYDGATIRLYVNGVLESSRTASFLVNTNTVPLNFGAQDSGDEYPFTGALDEIRIWNIARSTEDIRADMNRLLTGGEAGLQGYWNFDEESGPAVFDKTVHANNGQMQNMDAGAARNWSGAALGHVSAVDFDPAEGFTSSLAAAENGSLSVTAAPETASGLQLYFSEDDPLRSGAVLPQEYSMLSSGYWGVKVVGAGSPPYDLVFNYAGHQGIGDERQLTLLKRKDHADPNWIDAEAVLDIEANTLTLSGATGTEYVLANSNTPLPVSFGLFTAQRAGTTIVLRWETHEEIDNSGFYVERSADGLHFTALDFVPSAHKTGNTATTLTYQYTDFAPLKGNNFYRLKQVDRDGGVSFTRIVTAVAEGQPTVLRPLYPNPVRTALQVTLNATVTAPIEIAVHDPAGRVISRYRQILQPGRNELTVRVDGLRQGIYFLKITGGSGTTLLTTPFVKQP